MSFEIRDHGIGAPDQPEFPSVDDAVDQVGDVNEEGNGQGGGAELVKEDNRAEAADRIGQRERPRCGAEAQRQSGERQSEKSRGKHAVQIALGQRKTDVVLRFRVVHGSLPLRSVGLHFEVGHG